MSIELKIPDVGESIQEVQIGHWLKKEGDDVQQDENVVELETDKASMDLPAPTSGRLVEILKQDGDMVSVGDTIAYIEEGNGDSGSKQETSKQQADDAVQEQDEKDETAQAADPDSEDPGRTELDVPSETSEMSRRAGAEDGDNPRPSDPQAIPVTPSGRRALREHGLRADDITPQGKRIRREDVERHVADDDAAERKESDEPSVAKVSQEERRKDNESDEAELEELVPMSLIRRRIAERLVEAQQTAALVTTFNEIDVSNVMALRKKYQDRFQQRYDVKLGFMSFFVKAAVDALKQFPELNAEIRGTDILYRRYFHIGIAIGSGKGLVVPVLKHAERMSFAEVEKSIDDLGQRARVNKIRPDELQGGTFTISNGGIYGSLLSTPIINPPQSGVLGMHTIQERPVARNGEVVIRPMMYIALTYDHRIVDGEQAVSALKRIKEAVEEPARMLLEV